jgi:hypothetical protein
VVVNEPRDSGAEPTSVARSLAAPIALTVFLAVLVALGSRGAADATGSSGRSAGLGLLLLEVIGSVGLVMALVGVWLMVVVWPRRRRKKPERQKQYEGPRLHWAIKLVLVMLAVGLIAGLISAARALGGGEGTPLGEVLVPSGGAIFGSRPSNDVPEWPPFPWVLAAVVAVSVIAGLVIWRWFARGDDSPAASESPEVFERALDDGLAALERETDPRRAVILAYVAMERALARRGLSRHIAEAPVEYMLRVLHDIPDGREPANRLTDLFEEARFSHHTISTAERDGAVHALVDLRAVLLRPAT